MKKIFEQVEVFDLEPFEAGDGEALIIVLLDPLRIINRDSNITQLNTNRRLV